MHRYLNGFLTRGRDAAAIFAVAPVKDAQHITRFHAQHMQEVMRMLFASGKLFVLDQSLRYENAVGVTKFHDGLRRHRFKHRRAERRGAVGNEKASRTQRFDLVFGRMCRCRAGPSGSSCGRTGSIQTTSYFGPIFEPAADDADHWSRCARSSVEARAGIWGTRRYPFRDGS